MIFLLTISYNIIDLLCNLFVKFFLLSMTEGETTKVNVWKVNISVFCSRHNFFLWYNAYLLEN